MSRHRPHGWVRHYSSFLSPSALSAVGVLCERDRQQRLRRLTTATLARARDRRGSAQPRMRALQVSPGTRLSWKSTPAPRAPGPNAAVVHPIAIATCDIDCPLALGVSGFALPLHLGHECVAEVVRVGERVNTVKPGDLTIVPFEINCGGCAACLAGHTGNCLAVPPISMYGMGLATGHWGGAYSDELAVPYADAMLVPLPAGIEPATAASLADTVCDAFRHIAPHAPALLERDPEAEILIVGALNERAPDNGSGSVGLYAGLIARAYGARNVRLVDAREHLRVHAQLLGLDAIGPRELRGRPPAPLVVDLTVNRLGVALAHTAPDGVCSSSGTFHRSLRIPAVKMFLRNATLHIGHTHARALIPQVLELMLDGRFQPQTVTTTLASLEDAPAVLREHFLGGGIKTVLTV
jgi:alcohol dehydrogenase